MKKQDVDELDKELNYYWSVLAGYCTSVDFDNKHILQLEAQMKNAIKQFIEKSLTKHTEEVLAKGNN